MDQRNRIKCVTRDLLTAFSNIETSGKYTLNKQI